MAKKIKLTAENYYGQQANIDYYSVSQIKSFLDCPTKAMAELDGTHQHEMSNAMLIGSYVDSYFSGELKQFTISHPEIFNSRTGELKVDFKIANEVIEKFEHDPIAYSIITSGNTQKIATGKIAGFPFKAKLDFWLTKTAVRRIAKKHPGMSELLFAEGAIVDMKVMRDFEPIYV